MDKYEKESIENEIKNEYSYLRDYQREIDRYQKEVDKIREKIAELIAKIEDVGQ